MSASSYKASVLRRMDSIKYSINKNVNQMDLENNKARIDMENIAEQMIAKIDRSIEKVQSYMPK